MSSRRKATIVGAVAVLLAGGLVVALVLLPAWKGAGGSSTSSPSPTPSPTPAAVVETDGGFVRGAVIEGVPSYLGIPYAAPPLGALRWRPPQPASSWAGIKECVSYGPSCPQSDSGYQSGDARGAYSEDCLRLNVYTPASSSAERLPVMVWIHGGGFTSGSGVLPNYQGQTLARSERVVVVSINYRLGVFGFFALPELSEESTRSVSGNYGLMDQSYALGWVHRNIAAFGGDPERVTIFGCSAGGQSVLLQYVSPLSRGLFARAVSQSARYQDYGVGLWATLPLRVQEVEGEQISHRLGISNGPGQLAALRAASVDDLLRVTAPDTGPYPLGFVVPTQPSFQPVVDGYVVPAQVWKLLAVGSFARVPLLLGSNAEECNMWMSSLQPEEEATVVAGARAELALYMGAVWPKYKRQFPPAEYGSVMAATSKMMTVAEFYAPARFAAHCVSHRGVPAFLYYFTQEPPATSWGATHTTEIPYVFGTERDAGSGGEESADARLSAVMSGYWASFAATGDPNGDGRPQWPAYLSSGERLMRLGEPGTRAVPAPYRKAADLVEIAADVL